MKYKNEKQILEVAINYYLIKICDDVINDHHVFDKGDMLGISSDRDLIGDRSIIFTVKADRNIDYDKLYNDNIENFFMYLENNCHYENIKEEFEEKGIFDYQSLAGESYIYHIMFLKYSLKNIMDDKMKEYKKFLISNI